MNPIQTPYGKLLVLDLEPLFKEIINTINQIVTKSNNTISIGLTGGSTPKAFYQWVTEQKAIKQETLNKILWMTSDERYVSLDSPESNFGNADRLMLTPLSVPQSHKRPWSVSHSPQEAAAAYNNYFNPDHCFDLCLLGMGDDCHIASLFPESPLISHPSSDKFTSIDVPNKGPRLTITPQGLNNCHQILMIVTGSGKKQALAQVLQSPFNPLKHPAQLHKSWPNKVLWLLDPAAASELSL